MTLIGEIQLTGYLAAGSSVLPLVIDLRLGSHCSQIILNPVTAGAELCSTAEHESGISAIEAEAVGVSPAKACKLVNHALAGSKVRVTGQGTASAMAALYDLAKTEQSFEMLIEASSPDSPHPGLHI